MSPRQWSQNVLRQLERCTDTVNSSEAHPPSNTRAETTFTVLPHLPNETILAIVGQLEFSDLKSARLLSKAWCFCASSILFANLSVSPNKEDLENFEAITQHPQLRSQVRHLCYDGSEFLLQLSKPWYLNELLIQLSFRLRPPPRITETGSSDPEMRHWAEDIMDGNTHSLKDTMFMFREIKFLDEGYRKYHEHAIYQQQCLQDGTFFDRLVQGLKQLDCLKVVELGCSWDFDDGPLEPGKGSHLARNWNLRYCRPASWEWGPRTDRGTLTNRGLPYKARNGAENYCILVSALAKAQRRIRAFQTSPDRRCLLPPYVFDTNLKTGKAILNSRFHLPPYVFDTNLKTRKAKALQFRNDNVIAFSGVEELDLRFATYGNINNPKLCKNIAGLPALLGSLDHLKSLGLRLPAFRRHFRFYYTYDQVFPKKMRWENLKVLKLSQLCVGATDLVLLFLDAMPGLKDLEMGDMGLSQGCWEGVFEALKQMHRLQFLRLQDCARFWHHGDQKLVVSYLTQSALYHQLAAYVKNGERHPSLRPEQPNSAAREFTKDLEPVLQQRLLDLDSSSLPAESAA